MSLDDGRGVINLPPRPPLPVDVLRTSRDVCVNIKDAEGRIMALNRRNCEVCNIRREIDAIGKRSDDLFAPVYASTYMALDRAALAAKKPIRGRVTCWPADGPSARSTPSARGAASPPASTAGSHREAH